MKTKILFQSLMLAAVALFVVLLPQPARADTGVIPIGCTNRIGSNSIVGVNLGGFAQIDNQEYISVTMRWISGAPNAGNITAFLQRNQDGTLATTETAPTLTFTAAQIAVQGATNIVTTNLPVSYVGASSNLKCYALSNSVVVGDASNFSLTIGKKNVLTSKH